MTLAEQTTNHIQTLPLERVVADQTTDESGRFFKDRVISTISSSVIRRDGPEGPDYQEALGYSFLVNNCKFPGLMRMDDGTLVLTLSASLKPPDGAPARPMPDASMHIRDEALRDAGLILFSKDEGMSWTSPRRIHLQRCTPINLGGKKLMLRGYPLGRDDDSDKQSLSFSDDAGESFGPLIPVPNLTDGRPMYTDVSLNPLVENGKVTFLFYTPVKIEELRRQGITGQSLLRRFDPQTSQWGEPHLFPTSWRTSEGSLARAKDGGLVAAFRTYRPGVPAPTDHWRGILTCRSMDDGRTWSEPAIHFRYGHHHQSLRRLVDGRILMTYAARIGELDGRTYHGVEAVVSRDHGVTWDWDNRYILFRASDQGMHSPQSVQLHDGRILTVLMHSTDYSWSDYPDDDQSSHVQHQGHVSVVIWSLFQ